MDFAFITGFFDQVRDFFQYVWNWFNTGVYELIKEFFVVATKVSIYSALQMALFSADIALEVVQDISADLNITGQAQSAYNAIPATMRNTLNFFGIPQVLTIILAAIPVRWAMKFIPIIGR